MTFIWIVAIERYGRVGGAKGALDIPEPIGLRAIELAAACAARDPLARIVLSVSLPVTESYRQVLQALPATMRVTDATQAALQNALELLRGEGTLLTYWVGHGIMSNDKRLVLCADSEDLDDLRALDVDSFLRHLRSANYPRMQIGFFDACANVFPQPTVTSLGGPGNTPTDQYFYFAASAAQVAPADLTRSGFSSTVITALLDAKREFPPRPAELFNDLRRQFDEVGLSTRAFPLQWTESSGESWSRQGPAQDEALLLHARAAWCGLGEFEHLRDAAGGCIDDATLSASLRQDTVDGLLGTLRASGQESSRIALLADAWDRLKLARSLEDACLRLGLSWPDWLALQHQVAAIDSMQRASTPDSIVDLLLYVLGQARRERGWDSAVRLLALAARHVRPVDAQRADSLIEYLRRHPVLQSRVDAAIASLPEVAGPAFLLIGLLCEGADKLTSVAGSWVYVNGELDVFWEFKPSALPVVDHVNKLIEVAKARYRNRPLVVELLTPNELLCSPCELLEVVDSELDTRVWLEEQNAFTLRWHDRMKGDARYQPGTWIQRTRATEKELLGNATMVCSWAGEPTAGHILGIPFPGPTLAVPQRNRGQFFTELKRGAPYMCWPRVHPTDLSIFKKSVCDLVLAAHDARNPPITPADRLIQLAEALRAAKQGGNADLRNLWLFVDDPARNPYQWHYSEPSDQGSHEGLEALRP